MTLLLVVVLLVVFAALFALAFLFARTETFVGNNQLLDPMIPHHSRAILVCEQSDISDPEIKSLCQGVIKLQQDEIDQM